MKLPAVQFDPFEALKNVLLKWVKKSIIKVGVERPIF